MRGRVDGTQAEIVAVLEAVGATVIDLSQVGCGCPDVLVGFQGGAWLVECKSARGQLRPSQVTFRETWRGPAPVVLRSRDDAIAWVRAIAGRPVIAAPRR